MAVSATDEANAKKAARSEAVAPGTAPDEKLHTQTCLAELQAAGGDFLVHTQMGRRR